MLQSTASPTLPYPDIAHVLGRAQGRWCNVCFGEVVHRVNVRCLSCLRRYAHFECAARSVAPSVCRDCDGHSSERSGFMALMRQARPRPALLLRARCCGCLLASVGLWWRPGRVGVFRWAI